MNNRAFYAYNSALHSNGDESHPFIASGGNGQLRTNISAARQFNESPSFQRLVTTALTENNNNTSIQQQNINAMNTLARNRYNTMNNRSNLSSHNNNNNNNNNNINLNLNKNNNNINNLNMNRVDDCMLNTDPYLTYKGAQTLSRQGNYSQSNYYSNYGNYGGVGGTTTNAVK